MTDVQSLEGRITIIGLVDIPAHNPFIKAESLNDTDWPKRILQVNFKSISSVLHKPVYPVLLRLRDLGIGLPSAWQPVNMTPAKHKAYAFQWGLLALVIGFGYVAVLYRMRRIRHV